MICRTHGLPMEVPDPEDTLSREEIAGEAEAPERLRIRTVCHLNFPDGPGVHELDQELVLAIARVDGMLGIIDRLGGDGAKDRVDLLEGLSARFLLARGSVTKPP